MTFCLPNTFLLSLIHASAFPQSALSSAISSPPPEYRMVLECGCSLQKKSCIVQHVPLLSCARVAPISAEPAEFPPL